MHQIHLTHMKKTDEPIFTTFENFDHDFGTRRIDIYAKSDLKFGPAAFKIGYIKIYVNLAVLTVQK